MRHIRGIDEIRKLERVDLVYSIMVLQHNPPPVIRLIVREFLRALNPGGVAYFQVPTYMAGYGFDAEAYLAEEDDAQGDGDAPLPTAWCLLSPAKKGASRSRCSKTAGPVIGRRSFRTRS